MSDLHANIPAEGSTDHVADGLGFGVPVSTPADCQDCALIGGCTLAEARAGDHMIVTAVNDERARLTALRFGMAEGACVSCVTRIPAGPIVLKSGRQEIAVGRELAKRITVRPAVDSELAKDVKDAKGAGARGRKGRR